MNFTPQTEVHLLSGVPFNFTYNNVRDFSNEQEQVTYFMSKKKYSFDKLTYQRVTSNTIKLDINYNDLLDVNYMMFKNDVIRGKWFYAFITNYEFVSPNVTRIEYQLDVFQTYLFDYNFQTTYVEREHTKRFNQDGSPVINTIDEGLSFGTDYKTTYKTRISDDIVWLVAVTKSSVQRLLGMTVVDSGNVANIRQTLYYTLIPISLNNNAITIEGHPSAIDWLLHLGDSEETVGQLVSIFYTENVPFTYTLTNNNIHVPDDNMKHYYNTSIGAVYEYYGNSQWNAKSVNISNDMYQNILPNYSESKLLMYPYTLIELTDLRGNTVTLKPQNFDSKVLSFGIRSCVSTQPKTAIYPLNYAGNTAGGVVDFTNGIVNNNICDIPIVDSYTASYMQSNRNSIALTNKYSMDNALRSISQNKATNKLDNAILSRQQAYTETDAKIGMASSLLNLNLGGALQSGYNAIKQYDMLESQRASMNLNNKFANENLMINAEQQIGSTQAKLNDINNIPPTISNLGNNTMFDTGWKNMGFYVFVKTIKDEYATQLTNYFKMFGYKVNKLEIPNTKSRRHYNYIKTVDANIVGDIPNTHLNTLKGIFDKGITIWHTNSIGDYSLSNEEV